MTGQTERQERALQELRAAFTEAIAYFGEVDAELYDGYQTASDVLAHLVFWNCEHITVAQALLEGSEPALKAGSLLDLNEAACNEARGLPLEALIAQMEEQQVELDRLLRHLPDWSVDFPIKQGGRPCTVEDRVFALVAHIDNHVAQLRRIEVRVETWHE